MNTAPLPSIEKAIEQARRRAGSRRAIGSVLEAVGDTPMVRVRLFEKDFPEARIYAKLEQFNPGGSIKDRVALSMLREAEQSGHLKPGGTLVEPTSGNTGIGLSLCAAALGYRAIVVTPATSRAIRRETLRHFGAEVIETDPKEGMAGAVREAQRQLALRPGAFLPQQFKNPANPAVHAQTTAQEILEALEGRVPTALVAGLGTGGTLTGLGRTFKERDPACRIVAVEPALAYTLAESPNHPAPRHCLEGIGVGFVPENLDRSLIDETVRVTEEEASAAQEKLARNEGVLVGPSSGAVFAGALAVARTLPESAEVVVVLADTGERYFRAKVTDS